MTPAIRIIRSSDAAAVDALLAAERGADRLLERRVADIVSRVRRSGDRALVAYARRFDKLSRPIELTPEEVREGAARTPAAVRRAIAAAARRIRAVARRQVVKGFRVRIAPGVVVEQRVTPLDRVGCYVPGGRYPLPSSLLMTAIPARAAGVPEVIVACPQPGPAAWIAADLIAQAEHDLEARAIFITSSRALAGEVAAEVTRRMPREGPARQSLRRHGGIIVTRHQAEAIALANRAAPEHLVCTTERVARAIRCAGAIFIGLQTAQVAGDYAIGSNHVLPTNGAARFRGGLSAADFVRVTSVQRVTARGLAAIGPTAVTLARAEGLSGHAASIEVRTR